VNRLNSLYVGYPAKEELYVIGVKGRNGGYPFDLLPLQDYSPSEKPERRRVEKAEATQAFSVRHSHTRTEYRVSPDMHISLEERRRGEFIHRVLSYVEYAEDGYQDELLKSIGLVKKESGADYPEQEIEEAVIGLIEQS
jgi:hypothetical protein